MADTDMAFTASHIAALLSFVSHADVVGCRYKGWMPATGAVEEAGYFTDGEFTPINGDVAGELVDVDVVGAGLMAIRREVFVDMARRAQRDEMPWWRPTIRDGKSLEEDWSFCRSAKDAGHRVALAAQVVVAHMKTIPVY